MFGNDAARKKCVKRRKYEEGFSGQKPYTVHKKLALVITLYRIEGYSTESLRKFGRFTHNDTASCPLSISHGIQPKDIGQHLYKKN